MRILIADDDRDLVELMAMVLEAEGHEVRAAYNGDDAVTLACVHEFDIAFLDVRMPQQNGVKSLRAIRRQKPGARVVIMTGYSREDLLAEALGAGAETILQKPIAIPEVLRLLSAPPAP